MKNMTIAIDLAKSVFDRGHSNPSTGQTRASIRPRNNAGLECSSDWPFGGCLHSLVVSPTLLFAFREEPARLHAPHTGIVTVQRQQLRVCAVFNDFPGVEHDDTVEV